MPCLASVLHTANAWSVGCKREVGWAGPQRGIGEQAGDTLMDLSPASHNHSPGHSRTEREREKKRQRRGGRDRDRGKRKIEWKNRVGGKGGIGE